MTEAVSVQDVLTEVAALKAKIEKAKNELSHWRTHAEKHFDISGQTAALMDGIDEALKALEEP